MLKYISTYYALQQMAGDEWSGQARARSALTPLAGQMALCFRDYLFMASLGESRHAIKRIVSGFEGFYRKSRSDIFEMCTQYAPSDANLQRMINLFEMSGWGTGYGGKKWADIVRLAGQYGKLSDTLFVDAVINCQHNGGTAFNKTEASSYMDIDFSNGILQYLIKLLDYRRKAENYLELAYQFFNGKKLTLACGRLALLYGAEKGFTFEIGRFTPIPAGTYNPVKWGTKELPPLVAKPVEVESDSSDDDDDDEYEDDDDEEVVRCPICLQPLSCSKNMKTECGTTIHAACLNEHWQHCPECHAHYDEPGKPSVEHCAICQRPVYLNDDECWHQKIGHAVVHKFCYWQEPEKAFNTYEVVESRNFFDTIGTLCKECGKPILNGWKSVDGLHLHCYKKQQLVDGKQGEVCDCSSCITINKPWRELFNVSQETSQADQQEVQPEVEEVEIHEYEVSAQGHQEIKPQVKETHVPTDFQPADDDTTNHCLNKLADYVHASPALS